MVEIADTLPAQARRYPEMRYMGSKHHLLPWLHGALAGLHFETAADPFCGSGCVSYLLRAMGKTVQASDFLNFPSVLAAAALAPPAGLLGQAELDALLSPSAEAPDFIARNFHGVFYTPEDLRTLDLLSHTLRLLPNPHQQAVARAAMIRSCLKKQPRGVFTISGDLSRYDDGRRDLRLSIAEHFREQAAAFNALLLDDGRAHSSHCISVFEAPTKGIDLVYLDPPYVPRSDDNCYTKRYHFLEGLSCYWEGMPLRMQTKSRMIAKRPTPFGYRHSALAAFEQMFAHWQRSIIVLSYSSNAYPDLATLQALLGRFKGEVQTYCRPHRYHFGTHRAARRTAVEEYLIVGC